MLRNQKDEIEKIILKYIKFKYKKITKDFNRLLYYIGLYSSMHARWILVATITAA